MASSFLPRLLKRRSTAATSSLRPFHALSSLHALHFSPSPSQGLNPTPSLPKNIEHVPDFAFSSHSFTIYPTFPHCSHLGPVSLSEASRDCLVGAQSTSLSAPNYAFHLKFDGELNYGVSVARFSNVGLIRLSEAVGLEGEREKDVVIRADSVKKKRKRKMNKHKLRKLRKKLRRKT